jgi:hypothetical protein
VFTGALPLCIGFNSCNARTEVDEAQAGRPPNYDQHACQALAVGIGVGGAARWEQPRRAAAQALLLSIVIAVEIAEARCGSSPWAPCAVVMRGRA